MSTAPSEARVSFQRHNGFVSPEILTDTLNIIGVGATGSNVAVAAAKMGFTKFKIWDHDVVEAHNLPNQAYDLCHVGMPKVEALKEVLQRFNPEIEVEANQCYFTAAEHGDELEGPLILTVDTMKAREEITNCFDGNILVDTVMESRLGFDHGTVNIIETTSEKDLLEWRNSLMSDDEVEEGPCGLRICTTMVGMVANFMVQQLCQKYARYKNTEAWNPKKKTVFYFNEEGVITYSP
jgi:hypothetical protein